MTDLVVTAPGRLDVRPAAPARPNGPDEVVVEVDRVTLCGSDYGLFHGTYGGPSRYPLRFGHEWSGRVVAAGRHARPLLGRAVTGDCSRWCGACRQCREDRNRCERIEKFGLTVDGFSVRRRTVHRRYLYPDDHGLAPGTLAMAEFFAVVHHALRPVAAAARGADVLVVGAGALGLAAQLLLARAFGAGGVTVMERDPAKRRTVAGLLEPVTELGPPPDPDDLAAVDGYRAMARRARHPLVVECSGTIEGVNCALALAGLGATVVWLGLPRPGTLRPDLVVAKGLTVRGSIGGTGDFPAAMRFLADHEERAAAFVTHRHPAAAAARALAAGPAERAAAVKVQLDLTTDAGEAPVAGPRRPGDDHRDAGTAR
ncbi:alcohol dehydrogenase catalytic domain-containing protein [Streptomyces bohaiensis]|uniref:2-deoxy-scyllo-inosamine dehydrogenase n=1 Tax=Streptomyces bohaiensis TaxID=1431344 RepID=A0ABX1CDT0_9ACTN|nr:alcohol dehydrogenase catalytic domain-containing protein [Streptomyces bohaiensis]NJQ16010.1 alcohol dehydrogenase catalytic domain-containing protein [Streptomyces bohaiensis]